MGATGVPGTESADPHLRFRSDERIVEDHLDDCEIFRDVPTGYRGVLRSVDRKGVRQRISLKAVNNIAIVGTGSGLGFIKRRIRP